MALVRNFIQRSMARNSIQKEIKAYYTVFQRDNAVFLQINTVGSDERETPGSTSQTIQFDKQGAEMLFSILKQAFHFR